MKKRKIYLSFLVILLFVHQITFAQTAVTAQAVKTPATSSTRVKVFAKAVVLQNSFVHLVWENYDPSEIQSMVLESSDDGLTFSQIDYALLSGLIDIHLYNYPEQMDYNNHILMSSEHGGIRFMYNDVFHNRDLDHHPVWYRIKMKSFSGITFISQDFSSDGKKKNENMNFTNGADASDNNKQTISKTPCPAVDSIPAGYISSGITQSHIGACCSWIETLYIKSTLVNPDTACQGLPYWCCNNVPIPAGCVSGYAVDYCCVHNCSQYLQCSCIPWLCCLEVNDSLWLVSAVNLNLNPVFDVTSPAITICEGSPTILTTNCTANCIGITYLWLPDSLTGASIIVNPSNTITYTIIGTNSNIIGPDTTECSSQYTITINVNPNPLITPTAIPGTICAGDSSLLVATSNIPGTIFGWSPVISGSPMWVKPVATTTYTVVGLTPSGCTGINVVTVTVDSVPPVPTITQNLPDLISSSSTGNQWFYNGTLIPGATSQFYTVLVSGIYQVQVTSSFGCFSISDTVGISVGIKENSEGIGFNIYPNPANDMITFETSSSQQDKVISLLNVLGQIVMQQPMTQQRSEIDVRRLSKGLYFLKLTTKNGSVVRKFVKE
jgi:hypothetical protein